jgi:hypothetical protein
LTAALLTLSVILLGCTGSSKEDPYHRTAGSSREAFEDGSFPLDKGDVFFCLDFSDLNPGPLGVFKHGDIIVTDGRRVTVEMIQGLPPLPPPTPRKARAEDSTHAGGTAPELGAGGTNLAFDLDGQARYLEVRVGGYGGVHNIEFNGQRIDRSDPLEIWDVAHLGNVIFAFIPSATDSRVGLLRARGFINEFSIGGQEVVVDDFCAWRDDGKPVDSDLVFSPFSTTFWYTSGSLATGGTRGIEATLLGTKDRKTLNMVLEHLDLGTSASAVVKARIYEIGKTDPIATAEVETVGGKSQALVEIPIEAVLTAGKRYVFCSVVDSLPVDTALYKRFSKGGYAYHENEAIFLIHSGLKGNGDALPTTRVNEMPRISVRTVSM